MFDPQSSKPDFYTVFQTVHIYRSENHIFEQSISQHKDNEPFRFYDGPPFITGLPHYGHLASSVAKDVIPRYQTMKGKTVDRVRGRDCHGIPIEQKVQKKLGLESNLDIEQVGIETFIEGCYDYTRSTSSERKRYIDQFARWVDFDNSYKTMDNDYMESVRRVFKTLWDKGLIYKGKRVSLYSTKLETPISNFEVAMDDTYEEVNDPAITVIFNLTPTPILSERDLDHLSGASLLVRTTTPWTIPVNIAAGVHKDITYAVVECGDTRYIVATNRVEAVFTGKEYAVIEEFLGEKLVGLSYKPPFDYLYGKTGNPNDHKIYHADFVSDEDGTGLVHEAPEFGEVDFQLAKQVGLTVTEAMDSSGHMNYICYPPTPRSGGLSQGTDIQGQEPSSGTGRVAKPGGAVGLDGLIFYRDANPIVIQELHDMGRLFHKASVTHRVAFCPRSGTPLVYKAQDSRFIDINGPQEIFGGKSLKEQCIEANEDINRYPAHNKYGRFLKSLESAPDRCISRTRYWGTPMPIYKAVSQATSDKLQVTEQKNLQLEAGDLQPIIIGSREELFKLSQNGSKNLAKFILVRHGEATKNVEDRQDVRGDSPLTENGLQDAERVKNQLTNLQLSDKTNIYISPMPRAFQTALPYLETLGYKREQLEWSFDEVLAKFHNLFDSGELIDYIAHKRGPLQYQIADHVFIDFRITETLTIGDHGPDKPHKNCSDFDRYQRNLPISDTAPSETVRQARERLQDFLTEMIHHGDGIVFSHADTLVILKSLIQGQGENGYKVYREKHYPKKGSVQTIYYNTTRNVELDLHRPYVDDVWFEKDGIRYERISEVLDCRVESASMPYAQVHYPFENKEKFEQSFPADYIVEYTGQIRAWFYVMHVLGVALFGKPAYKNVICHGVVAGDDGRKMSKSLGNFPDPKPTFEQYGGDAVRMAILTSPLFNGGDVSFSEDLVKEALKQNILPLRNAFYFFITYANIDKWEANNNKQQSADTGSKNLLDQWILSELQSFTMDIESCLDNYDLTQSSRLIAGFLDNLTNRYIRRSRRRFRKSENDTDKDSAYQTLYDVLRVFCIVAAPFMPIVTEYVYRALTGSQKSVHLEKFPIPLTPFAKGGVGERFAQSQTIVRAGLAARSKRSIRVRQPLALMKLGAELDPYFVDLIADELNIKSVVYDPTLNDKVTKICKPDGKIIGAQFGEHTKEIFALAKSGQFVEGSDGSVVVGEWMLEPGSFEISYIKKNESDSVEVEEGIAMEIDRELTEELLLEGYARDVVRVIQDARKEAGYDIADRIGLSVIGGSFAEHLINQYGLYIQDETLSTITYMLDAPDITKSLELGGQQLDLALKKHPVTE